MMQTDIPKQTDIPELSDISGQFDISKKLEQYKQDTAAIPREEKIRETISASKDSFFKEEEHTVLSRRSFLYIQFRLIRKRWWLLQCMVLLLLWILIPLEDQIRSVYRSMGAASSLFVILLIPELWKNRTNQCMEIESAAYYSLRQVYAARMLLFGITDTALLTVFCTAAALSLEITLAHLLTQFLFPMTVTACICFGILCSRRMFSEEFSAGMCIIWCAVWWFIILDERIYAFLTIPVWIGLFSGAAAFLIYAVRRSIRQCSVIWEGTAGCEI